jgi:hypothetical protein
MKEKKILKRLKAPKKLEATKPLVRSPWLTK